MAGEKRIILIGDIDINECQDEFNLYKFRRIKKINKNNLTNLMDLQAKLILMDINKNPGVEEKKFIREYYQRDILLILLIDKEALVFINEINLDLFYKIKPVNHESLMIIIKTVLYCLEKEDKKFINSKEKEREMEKQLRQASKMEAVGTLASGIAHDFNNILGVIFGFSELALEEVEEDSQVFKYLKKILNSAEKAKDLIYQILKFSRGTEINITSINVIPMIKEFIKLLRSITPSNISIKHQIECKSDHINGEPMQFQQVLMHICSNASEAMLVQGGTLTLVLSDIQISRAQTQRFTSLQEGDYLLISISDTGKGMENEIRDRIFEPYFTTKIINEGTGLGLAITYRIVKEFGGDILVSSTPGQGTKFDIYFPKTKKVDNENYYIDKKNLQGNESILFIDDEKELVEIWEKNLREMGYKINAVDSSITGYNIFKENPKGFDLIITDMTMPHMTGIQLSRKLRYLRGDIPVIICTGYNSVINEKNFKTLGINALLMKPLIKKNLLAKIREVLDAKG